MSLNTEFLCVVTTEDNLRLVQSGTIVNLSEVIAADRPNRIEADEIYVAGEVRTDGQPVTLIARIVRFADGAKLITDGARGLPDFPAGSKREADAAPGTWGPDGEFGGAGRPAGDVTIIAEKIVGTPVISSKGGKGGRPRDGGDGRPGRDGGNGRDAIAKGKGLPEESKAGDGLAGGAAGLPGGRGPGGPGGHVLVRTLEPVVVEAVVTVDGGDPSEPGNGGKVGAGGKAGKGGRVSHQVCEHMGIKGPNSLSIPKLEASVVSLSSQVLAAKVETPQSTAVPLDFLQVAGAYQGQAANTLAYPFGWICEEVSHEFAPDGTTGPAGEPRTEDIEERRIAPPSVAGAASLDITTIPDLSSRFSDLTLDLMVLATEDRYRQAGLSLDEDLHQALSFLLALVVDGEIHSESKSDLLARVYVMARRINLGLDFYGYAKEDVPLVSFESYRELIDRSVIPQAKIIEETYARYRTAFEAKQVEISTVRDARQQAQAQRANFEAELERVYEEASRVQKQLQPLDEKVVANLALLLQRETELTAAIKKKRNNCNLVKTLSACAAIAAGISTGGVALIGAASAGAKLFEDIKGNGSSLATLWDARNLIGNDLTELGKQATKVGDALDDIGKAVDQLSEERPTVPKFTMERSKFDEVARDFADMEEAKQYREAGYAYLAAVETRNSAIVSYNGMLTQCIALQNAVDGANRAVMRIDTVLSGKVSTTDSQVMARMSRLYLDSLALVAMMVHTERKALAYHFVKPSDAPLSAFDLATIVAAHQKVGHRDWLAAKERYEVRRELEPGALTLDLQKLAGPDAWEQFRRSGTLDFVVRAEHPAYRALLRNLPGLRLTGVEIELDGAKAGEGQDQVPWIMAHGGRETIYDRTGAPVHFSHRALLFRGTTSLSGKKPIIVPDFSERNLYAGVSPFASWLFSFQSMVDVGLDLSELRSAKLKLNGYLVE